jgi:Tfp pilus assembly protein PilV
LGVAISVTGFVSIIITIIQSRQSIQQDIQQSSVDLFKELRSEKFIDARRRAWIVKEKWYGELGYK